MVRDEVLKLSGKPRSKTSFLSVYALNYGDIWVVFENDIVGCVVKSQFFIKTNECRKYAPREIIR